jgi:ribosomal protein S18 acetylase RimI-like enzyme
MRIRKANTKDIPALAKLLKGERAIEDYPNQYSPAVLREMIAWAHILVAEETKEVAGCAIFFSGGTRQRAYLDAIAVLKKYRAKGIGAALVTEFERHSKKEGATRAAFLVRPWNKPMQKLARRLGYPLKEKLLFYQKKI